ncbi:ATP-binding protein [uncultured Bifidobacterium sp.]|uniref:sensor histidine kinase n=1 Tax=uncultured Bifidobacterium sp. TaxID=165187 RepID=UPI0026134555|nr:ATP-binding protein [uncultured Bifidobacterium sp.]
MDVIVGPMVAGVALGTALCMVIVILFRRGSHAGRRVVDAVDGRSAGPDGFRPEELVLSSTVRGLVEAMPDAVVIVGATGLISYASAQSESLPIRHGGRLVAPDLLTMLSQVVEDGRTREREIGLKGVGGAGPSAPSTGRGVSPGEVPASALTYLRVRVARVGDGIYVMFVRDITERRRFESLRRDFVTNVSHELKTPAGAISLLAETIHDAADDSDAVRYFSSRVSTESARLVELVGRLIDVQRADIADPIVEVVPTSVMNVVNDAVRRTVVQAKDKGTDVRVSVDGDEDVEHSGRDHLVMADREALTVAVKNLVENAVRYSPSGSVVEVAVSGGQGTASIRVVDRGIGIPQESLGRIFERFYRVDPARSRATGGSGLGLSIVKHCVQECGGRISVWSKEGEGSTFTIELPESPVPSADQHGDVSDRGKRAVDDGTSTSGSLGQDDPGLENSNRTTDGSDRGRI